MKKTVKTLWVLLTAVVFSFAFAACGGDETGKVFDSDIPCPLDGQLLSSDSDHGDYVLVTSIDNSAAAMPQSGIGAADLLIEIPVEGGINRFMAFFYHSTPDTIGPIRSARHYFYDITGAYDAPLCHCGGSEQAYEIAGSGTVKDIDEMSCASTFWRIEERKAPHNLYTSYEKLSDKSAEREYNKISVEDCPSFNFMTADDVDALAYGGTAQLTIPYRYREVSYQWDESAKRYQRYSAGAPHVDAIDNTTVCADNVAVLYVSYSVMDEYGRLDMEISEGQGLLLQYGSVTKMNWTLEEGSGFVFTDAATEEELKLIPGKTIIQIASPEDAAEYTVGSGDSEKGAE